MSILNMVYGTTGSSPYKFLTYQIDQSKSNPSQMVTAISADAQAMSASDVIDFIGAKPVLLNHSDGSEYANLNPNNFQQFEDGTDASGYTANTNYDVMIKFPRRGYQISTAGNITTFTLTDAPNKSGYTYLPFQRLSSGTIGNDAVFQDVSAFYMGAYYGTLSGSHLRSWYAGSKASGYNIGTFSTYASGSFGGLGGLPEFLQEFYLQMCFLAIYKTTDAQTALGKGYVNGSSSGLPTTGTTTYDKGMNYGTTSGTQPIKFLGIENWYGGIWTFVVGWGKDGSGIHISIPNLTGSNRSTYSITPTGNITITAPSGMGSEGYITKVMGDTYGGFTPSNITGGSDTTYFSDYTFWSSSTNRVGKFGGGWDNGNWCGAFYFGPNDGTGTSGSHIGARLSFVPAA